MSKNNGGPVFPTLAVIGNMASSEGGMALRDYFAAKAMQGFAAAKCGWSDGITGMARCAYEWADAIRARSSA